jgi:hypothetical protein
MFNIQPEPCAIAGLILVTARSDDLRHGVGVSVGIGGRYGTSAQHWGAE